MNIKYIRHIHPHSPFLKSIYPQKRPILPSCLHFFKVYIDGPKGFHLGTSGLYILCFNQIIPPLLTLSLLPCPPSVNSMQYRVLCYVHIRIGCFNIFRSFTVSFPLPPPVARSDRLTNIILFSLSLYVCVYICVCVYIYIHLYILSICIYMYISLIDLASTYEGKHVTLIFWAWLTSLNMIFSSSIHLSANNIISFIFMANKTLLCIYTIFS
jgi:hypothetical protein